VIFELFEKALSGRSFVLEENQRNFKGPCTIREDTDGWYGNEKLADS
jgi:hypothetical protein